MLNAVGDFYGQPFLLLDWEYQVLWDVYGTVKDNGLRQYRYSYLEIAKKNGKTSLIASLALYHVACDGPGGEIYCCAADRFQAEHVYNAACAMREQNDDLVKTLKLLDSKKEIVNINTGTKIKVLSAEAYTKHGLNPTVVIFDELHCQPNRDLWDVMTFGAGAARKEPLWWVITTAGDDPDRKSIGWEIHEKARRIMDGEVINPAWYAKIYTCPDDADIYDEKNWYKANPSLGKVINIEDVRQEALEARNSEAYEKNFRWLRLNQWIALKSIGWLPLTLWDTTTGKWSVAELTGKRCYIGLDLSSTGDLTGACALFPPQEGIEDWRAIYECWIPEDSMNERIKRDGVAYDRWAKNKYLTATPGNAVDYEYVEARLLAMCELYEVTAICPDPWNSRMLTQRLDKAGVQIIEVKQDMANMSPAMKEMERLMKWGRYTHENNPVARWCFGNVNVVADGNGNIKPMKNRAKEKIDITVAEINAMSVAMRGEQESSIYDTRPIGEKIFAL
jgi:phage terminase large subunit-like protein